MARNVVLLKNGQLEVVSCEPDEVFLVAKVRGAGICGAFEDRASAEHYIDKLRREQTHWPSIGQSHRKTIAGQGQTRLDLITRHETTRGFDFFRKISKLSTV